MNNLRITEIQARAWQAMDAKLTLIEAVKAPAFVHLRMQELIQIARYWRKKINDAHRTSQECQKDQSNTGG